MVQEKYLFTSDRLGFREWSEEDILPMAAINADPEVMRYFPALQSYEQTAASVARMQKIQAEKGYCYFAVDTLHNNEFIGFIGLNDQYYEAPFTPCTDIGWRLKQTAWHKGYATEGAKRCLQYAFDTLQLDTALSVAPEANRPSINVMVNAGMTKAGTFIHPALADNEHLKNCVWYIAERNSWIDEKR